jgi:large subunit ribosomal protein L18
MSVKKKKYERRKRRIFGTTEKPRLVVFRSNRNIFGHIVDDEQNKVILGLSSLNKELKSAIKDDATKTATAKEIGKKLAEIALDKNIKKIVFDRNGYLYHGRVKAFAEGVREGGLEF